VSLVAHGHYSGRCRIRRRIHWLIHRRIWNEDQQGKRVLEGESLFANNSSEIWSDIYKGKEFCFNRIQLAQEKNRIITTSNEVYPPDQLSCSGISLWLDRGRVLLTSARVICNENVAPCGSSVLIFLSPLA